MFILLDDGIIAGMKMLMAARFAIVAALVTNACSTYGPYLDKGPEAVWGINAPPTFSSTSAPTTVKFLVLADIHGYAHKALVTDESVLAIHNIWWGKKQDTEFANTARIMDSLDGESTLDFVVLPGDLTVDGEKASHIMLAALLERHRSSGRPVFVVPGNHDVNSPQARRHDVAGTRATESVSPSEFAGIYARFGYADALSRDSISLSYVAEPVPGIALVVLDTARWYDNMFFPLRLSETGGSVRQETIVWIESVLSAAKTADKLIIAVQHHPPGMRGSLTRSSLKNAAALLDLYEQYGVAFIVSGHKHRFSVDFSAAIPRISVPSIARGPDKATIVEYGPYGVWAMIDQVRLSGE